MYKHTKNVVALFSCYIHGNICPQQGSVLIAIVWLQLLTNVLCIEHFSYSVNVVV